MHSNLTTIIYCNFEMYAHLFSQEGINNIMLDLLFFHSDKYIHWRSGVCSWWTNGVRLFQGNFQSVGKKKTFFLFFLLNQFWSFAFLKFRKFLKFGALIFCSNTPPPHTLLLRGPELQLKQSLGFFWLPFFRLWL